MQEIIERVQNRRRNGARIFCAWHDEIEKLTPDALELVLLDKAGKIQLIRKKTINVRKFANTYYLWKMK